MIYLKACKISDRLLRDSIDGSMPYLKACDPSKVTCGGAELGVTLGED